MTGGKAPVAVVSGSGIDLRPILDTIHSTAPFSEVADVPPATVAGHEGRFLRGRSHGHEVVVQEGRLHFHEGLSFEEVVAPVDALAKLGVQAMVFTNAVGGLREELEPGVLTAADEIRCWPFTAWRDQPERIVPDFVVDGCDARGCLAWMPGPNYETPAEIQLLRSRGCATVGMSTAPEVYRCRQLAIKSAVCSVVTNNCCHTQKLTHQHVLTTAARASERLVEVLRAWIRGLPVA